MEQTGTLEELNVKPGDKVREPFLIQSDAILAAMPEIIADMVEPLEWVRPDGVHETVVCEEAYFMNTVYKAWGGGAYGCDGEHYLQNGERTIAAAKSAANTHHRTTLLKALGMKEGE